MYEGYTEGAKNSIILGNFEANASQSKLIYTEHLLLGILRQDDSAAGKKIIRHLLAEGGITVEKFREELVNSMIKGKKLRPEFMTLFSRNVRELLNEIKLHKAKKGKHNDLVGLEDLLMGILRHRASSSAKFLRSKGITTRKIQKFLKESK